MNLGLKEMDSKLLVDLCSDLGILGGYSELVLGCSGFVLLPNSGRPEETLLGYATGPHFPKSLAGAGEKFRFLIATGTNIASDHETIPVQNPSLVFWTLAHFVNSNRKSLPKSNIHPSALIEPGVQIPSHGVTVGESTIIGAGAILFPGVSIGSNAVVGPNCVIGNDGFMVKETLFGRVRISHDAGVKIDDNVTLGALVNVDAGLFGEATQIERGAKIDSGVHVAHSAVVGSDSIVAAGAQLAGWVTLGNGVFLGVNAVIAPRVRLGEGAYIGAHAFLVRDVSARSKVAGRPAISLA